MEAKVNGKEKTSPLVSKLTPLLGVRMPSFSMSRLNEVRSGEAFVLTSQRQISRDLVEEWIALGWSPLCVYTKFDNFTNLNGYKGPVVACRKPKGYKSDESFVAYVESQAKKVCGTYLGKEQEAKRASLGSKRRLNRIFDLMGVAYEDRPVLEEKVAKDASTHASGTSHRPERAGRVADKRKGREPADV